MKNGWGCLFSVVIILPKQSLDDHFSVDKLNIASNLQTRYTITYTLSLVHHLIHTTVFYNILDIVFSGFFTQEILLKIFKIEFTLKKLLAKCLLVF